MSYEHLEEVAKAGRLYSQFGITSKGREKSLIKI